LGGRWGGGEWHTRDGCAFVAKAQLRPAAPNLCPAMRLFGRSPFSDVWSLMIVAVCLSYSVFGLAFVSMLWQKLEHYQKFGY
jgi:hypothetical protein